MRISFWPPHHPPRYPLRAYIAEPKLLTRGLAGWIGSHKYVRQCALIIVQQCMYEYMPMSEMVPPIIVS